eukprot:1193495-Prorocentrum_minimum.AAC.1
MYSRVHLGRDVADVDPLHFFVQSLIAATNFMIILAFRNEIRRKKQESRTKAQVQEIEGLRLVRWRGMFLLRGCDWSVDG